MPDRKKVIMGLECCMAEKICASKCPYKWQCDDGGYYYSKAIEDAISLLKTSVSQGVFDQIKWERDMAIAQLEEIGKGLGEKMDDVKEALKAQEPKPPVIKENAYGWKFFYCPSCGREFYADRKHGRVNKAKFCDKCGRALKWE